MDLKCLIKLLLEKGIINEEKTFWDNHGNVMVKKFSFEFIEVLEKIKNSKYDKEYIFVEEDYNSKQLFIANKEYLKEYLLEEIGDNLEGRMRANKTGIKDYMLRIMFKNDEDIKVKDLISGDIKVYNLREKRRLQKIRDEKKQEVLDFLDQLP